MPFDTLYVCTSVYMYELCDLFLQFILESIRFIVLWLYFAIYILRLLIV